MITIEANKLQIRLNNLAKGQSIENGMQKAVALVEASAKTKAPVDTGDLRRSISSKVEDSGRQGIVFTNLEYAPYVEYGTGLFAENGGRDTPWSYQDSEGNWHTTSGQKPQPYLRPALEENIEQIIELLRQEVANV